MENSSQRVDLRPRRELSTIHPQREISLAETLNRVLNKGAVLTGDITISVADIDLLYIGLNLIVSSVETMRQAESELVNDSLRVPNIGTTRPRKAGSRRGDEQRNL